jgi:hypothetical protein
MQGEARLRGLARAVRLKPSAMRGEARLRGLARAVGLMEIENLFRYPALAVGLKPSASQAKPACAGCSGLFIQRP